MSQFDRNFRLTKDILPSRYELRFDLDLVWQHEPKMQQRQIVEQPLIRHRRLPVFQKQVRFADENQRIRQSQDDQPQRDGAQER